MSARSEYALGFPGVFVTPQITAPTSDSDSAHREWARESALLIMSPGAADAPGPGACP